MAFLKTLNPLLRRSPTPIPNPRPLLSLHTFLASSPAPAPFAAAAHPHAPIRSGGPLFLSSPPWMLSQSATPLTAAAAALRAKLRSARALADGGAQVVADAVRWEPRWISGGDAAEAVVGGGERFLNLPNLVSIGRMMSGLVIGWMIVNEWYLPAFGTLALSGASDWLDGFLARKMGINSVFGSYLDPLADKVLIGCVAVAMVEKDLLHPGLVGLVVLRDLLLVGGAVYKRASSLGWKGQDTIRPSCSHQERSLGVDAEWGHQITGIFAWRRGDPHRRIGWNSWSDFVNLDAINCEKVKPLFISKVNTVFQLMLVAAALLQPEFGTDETQNYITYLSWLVASTTMASTVGYGVKYYRIRPMT